VQYARWVSNIVLHGSFWQLVAFFAAYHPMLLQRLPLTFELGFMA